VPSQIQRVFFDSHSPIVHNLIVFANYSRSCPSTDRRFTKDLTARGHQPDVFGSGTSAIEAGRGLDEIKVGGPSQDACRDDLSFLELRYLQNEFQDRGMWRECPDCRKFIVDDIIPRERFMRKVRPVEDEIKFVRAAVNTVFDLGDLDA